jgi:hypothetical protein
MRRGLIAIALVVACGEPHPASTTPATTVVTRVDVEREPSREEPDELPVPTLDGVDAIRAALLAASGDLERLLPLLDLGVGFDLDFDRVMGHFAHRACDEAELRAVASWLAADEVPLYELDDDTPFSCSGDLSRCVSCSPDLSDCDRATLFELEVGVGGRRYLAGLVPRPTTGGYTDELRTVEDFTTFDVGHFAEVGARCRLRAELRDGVTELWDVRVPTPSSAPVIEHLCGDAAAERARDLADLLDVTSWCDSARCFAQGGDEAYALYWEGTADDPSLRMFARGQPECDGCAPAVPEEIRRRVARERCPR